MTTPQPGLGTKGTSPVVLLVDNRNRDLAVATLIAHHLRRMGVEPHLQPLEAYRAVLAAFKPALVLINHLTASHLVQWSHRLKELGVLVAVLPNEGISYDRDDLLFMAGRYHNRAHIDHFFTWNEPHRDALREAGFTEETRIHVVGVPRFDFYFQPWSRLFTDPRRVPDAGGRRRVLCCTNFVFAKFLDLPRVEGDKFLQVWRRMPKYQKDDPWKLVEVNHRARQRSLAFLEQLLASPGYEVVLRPHPLEDTNFFRRWMEGLTAEMRGRLRMDSASNITQLIMECDVEISCETCTTAMESWIAGKPTVELTFERYPGYFHPEVGAMNLLCEDPSAIVATVERALNEPLPAATRALRAAHLQMWCQSPAGNSAENLARIIRDAVAGRPATCERLGFHDHRRAWMLGAYNRIGWPCNHDPLLFLKRWLFRQAFAIKAHASDKTITPADVLDAERRLQGAIDFAVEAPRFDP